MKIAVKWDPEAMGLHRKSRRGRKETPLTPEQAEFWGLLRENGILPIEGIAGDKEFGKLLYALRKTAKKESLKVIVSDSGYDDQGFLRAAELTLEEKGHGQ